MIVSARLLALMAALVAVPRSGCETCDVGTRKQLFIDRKFVEQDKGIEFHANPPIKRGQVLRGTNPWENGSIYGPATTVLEDGGKFRMWYVAAPVTKRPPNSPPGKAWNPEGTRRNFLCYAESSDGVHWLKPELGLYAWEGSKANNILMEAEVEQGAGIFLDPTAPPNQRYKLLAALHKRDEAWPNGIAPPAEGTGLYIFTSGDGLRWQLHLPRLLKFYPDTTNMAFFDERTRTYRAYVRIHVNGHRCVGSVESDDILQPWPYLKGRKGSGPDGKVIPEVFGADQNDPPEVDYYLPAVVKYPWADDAYFMFPSAYRHFPKPPEGRQINDGVLETEMAVSRDGWSFSRISKSPYIERGLPGAADSERTYMCVGMLKHADEIFQYYGGFDFTHGGQIDLSEIRGRGGIFLAAQRPDGFVSIEAGSQGGQFVTPRIKFSGARLILNLNASVAGEIRVELRDEAGSPVKGYSFAECAPLFANDLARVVEWREPKADVGRLAGTPVRLAFILRQAKLYGFQFID